MGISTEELMRRMKALQDAKRREREACRHTYKLPWTGCGYLQCSKCGKRTLNDD